MPFAAKHPCNQPGCPALVNERFCPAHKKAKSKEYERARPTASQRGYGAQWRKYRAMFIVRNPLCVECEKRGRLVGATVVDHIVPFKGDMALFWEPTNHRAVCAPCHNTKTAREDGGFGNTVRAGG